MDIRSFKFLLFSLLLVQSFISPSWCWGRDGHKIVAQLAQDRLSPNAMAAVSELLFGKNMSDVSSWPDEILSSPDYSWSMPLHYVNVPEVCNFDYSRDCGDKICVVGALHNYTDQLVHQKAGYNLTEALMFVIHFFGDIHQPLHVSFADDEGGNLIPVYWLDPSSEETELHAVWDYYIIDYKMSSDFGENATWTSYVDFLNQELSTTWAKNIEEWSECENGDVICPQAIAQESIHLACGYAYFNGTAWVENNDVLGQDYYDRSIGTVNRRLAMGGIRLASALNQIWG